MSTLLRDSHGHWLPTCTPDEDRQIAELYDLGYGVRTIGGRIGRSGEFVWRRLRAMGVKLRRPGGGHSGHFRISHREMDETIRMHRAGYSASEIAQATGVNASTVRYRLRMFGVERRSRSEAQRLRWARRKASGLR